MVGKRAHDHVHMVAETSATHEIDVNDLDMADLGNSRSSDVDAADNTALDIMATPSLQALMSTANDGFSTPIGPFLLDLPSISPNYPETLPKRMRSFSELTKQSQASLDWVADQAESSSSNLWEGFKESEATSRLLLRNSKPSKPSSKPVPRQSARSASAKTSKQGSKAVNSSQSKSLQGSGTKQKQTQSDASLAESKKRKNQAKTVVAARGSTPPTIAMPGVVMGTSGLPLAYSQEIRSRKVQSYLEKRKRRVWKKEVKYSCRKQFAESRPRVAGRFVPKTVLAALQGGSVLRDEPAATTAASMGNDDLLLSLG